jgi:hypothetical protein
MFTGVITIVQDDDVQRRRSGGLLFVKRCITKTKDGGPVYSVLNDRWFLQRWVVKTKKPQQLNNNLWSSSWWYGGGTTKPCPVTTEYFISGGGL